MRSGDVSVMFITEEYTQGRIKTRDENSREIEGGKGAKSGAEIPLKRIEGKPLEEGKRVNGSMGQRESVSVSYGGCQLTGNWRLCVGGKNLGQWKADVNLSAAPRGGPYLKLPSGQLDAFLHAE